MSINKILTLIGAALYSFTPLFFLFLTFQIRSINNYYSNLGTTGTADLENTAILVVLLVLTILSIILCALNWLAFVKLDGPKAIAWKTYLLIAGIIITIAQIGLYVIGAAPGILFILAYALNRNHDSKKDLENENGKEDDWSPIA